MAAVAAGSVAVVTGGGGFVGLHVVRHVMVAGSYTVVRAVDLAWSPAAVATLAALQRSHGERCRCEVVTANVCDTQAMAAVCNNADVVFHLAAVVDTRSYVSNPPHLSRRSLSLSLSLSARLR
jgi:nucleoside-diphosphate-sugar epimerase